MAAKAAEIISKFCIIFVAAISSVQSQMQWRRAFVINTGVSVDLGDVSTWYNSKHDLTYSTDAEEDSYLATPDGSGYTATSTNFKSRYIQYWEDDLITVEQVRIRICKDGIIQKTIIFNADGLSFNEQWLAPSRIVYDEWDDLSSTTSFDSTWYGVETRWYDRDFCLLTSAFGCDQDEAWFCISTGDSGGGRCPQWGEGVILPVVVYSPGNNLATQQSLWQDSRSNLADVFIMEIGMPGPPTEQPTSSTREPTSEPTSQPTTQPTANPTFKPTTDPTTDPTH